jgi:hypothetical protein
LVDGYRASLLLLLEGRIRNLRGCSPDDWWGERSVRSWWLKQEVFVSWRALNDWMGWMNGEYLYDGLKPEGKGATNSVEILTLALLCCSRMARLVSSSRTKCCSRLCRGKTLWDEDLEYEKRMYLIIPLVLPSDKHSCSSCSKSNSMKVSGQLPTPQARVRGPNEDISCFFRA